MQREYRPEHTTISFGRQLKSVARQKSSVCKEEPIFFTVPTAIKITRRDHSVSITHMWPLQLAGPIALLLIVGCLVINDYLWSFLPSGRALAGGQWLLVIVYMSTAGYAIILFVGMLSAAQRIDIDKSEVSAQCRALPGWIPGAQVASRRECRLMREAVQGDLLIILQMGERTHPVILIPANKLSTKQASVAVDSLREILIMDE